MAKDTAEVKVRGVRGIVGKELVPFTKQLASMTGAGMSILSTMQTLEEQAENPEFKKVLNHLLKSIEGGDPLSRGLAAFPKIFDEMYVNMVIAGEQSGEFAGILKRLATILQSGARLKKKVKSAMTYPTVIVSIALLMSWGLIQFVVPIFAEMFAGAGKPLPALTQSLVNLADFIKSWWYVIIVVVVAVLFAFGKWKATESGRSKFDAFKLKMPVFGQLVLKSSVGPVADDRLRRTDIEVARRGRGVARQPRAGEVGSLGAARGGAGQPAQHRARGQALHADFDGEDDRGGREGRPARGHARLGGGRLRRGGGDDARHPDLADGAVHHGVPRRDHRHDRDGDVPADIQHGLAFELKPDASRKETMEERIENDELNRRLALAEARAERSKVVMESLAGFCHALGQPATVLLSSVELLRMGCDEDTRKEILDMCYDAVIEIRSLLAQMKEKREYANEAYLAANEEAGTMISLKEWREKAPPRFDWDH